MKAYANVFKKSALTGLLAIPAIYFVFHIFSDVLPQGEPLRRLLVGIVITLVISQVYDNITMWSLTSKVNLNTERIENLEGILPANYTETPRQRELEKALEKGIGGRTDVEQGKGINS